MEKVTKSHTKKTDPSNSPSPLHILKVSIDKIRIVGDLNQQVIPMIFADSPAQVNILNIDESTGRMNGYIQTADDRSKLNFEFNPARANAINSSNAWFEWNPNKISDETVKLLNKWFLPFVTDAHITRLDIAFDFANDLSQAYLLRKSKSKSGIWFGAGGEIETRYFGSSQSDKHMILYNKKLELAKKQSIHIAEEHLWRFEVVLKGKKIHEMDKTFDNLELVIPDFTGVSISQRAMLEYLMARDDRWNELGSSASKSKYRKMIQKHAQVNITDVMRKELADRKESLIREANDYLEEAATADIIPEKVAYSDLYN